VKKGLGLKEIWFGSEAYPCSEVPSAVPQSSYALTIATRHTISTIALLHHATGYGKWSADRRRLLAMISGLWEKKCMWKMYWRLPGAKGIRKKEAF